MSIICNGHGWNIQERELLDLLAPITICLSS